MMDRWFTYLLIGVLLAITAGLFFSLLRAIRGPRMADRILGINMTGSLTTAAIGVLAVLLEQSSDNKHIVTTAYNARHADIGSSTRTFTLHQGSQVLRTVTQQRHPFLGQGSKHQFSHFSIRKTFQRFRINDFRIKMILVNM